MSDIELVAHRTAQEKSFDSSAIRAGIYDLTVSALMYEVFTLDRINSVLLAVRKGVHEGVSNSVAGVSGETKVARLEASRGLCSAASEVLVAIGLGSKDFFNLHGSIVPAEISTKILSEIQIFRQQLGQITLDADWQTNPQVVEMQLRWFQELSACIPTTVKNIPVSIVPWTERFFQECRYLPPRDGNSTQAYLLLLGLFTRGVFVGLRQFQRLTTGL